MVEILPEGAEQDVGASGLDRRVRVLDADRVADGTRVKTCKDRIDVELGDGRHAPDFGVDRGPVGGLG